MCIIVNRHDQILKKPRICRVNEISHAIFFNRHNWLVRVVIARHAHAKTIMHLGFTVSLAKESNAGTFSRQI